MRAASNYWLATETRKHEGYTEKTTPVFETEASIGTQAFLFLLTAEALSIANWSRMVSPLADERTT